MKYGNDLPAPSAHLVPHRLSVWHLRLSDHPERPGRVRAIMNALTRNYPDITTMLAPEATVEQVRGGSGRGIPAAARHVSPYAGIVQIDPDTAVMPASRAAIFRAAGAACFAVDEVMSGGAANAFCCVRPPGHHAEPDRAMGFCFFNNASIGALHAKASQAFDTSK
ncbi:unnamed protein product [Ectocarpus sp. 12 AP-2014]